MKIQMDFHKYLCVICQEIMVNPVTLPCSHTCCLNCLERTLDCNKYQCFLCRKFLGSWYRNAKRKNQLINHILSSEIAENYSLIYQEKIEREIRGSSSSYVTKISNPGEIKEEFDSFLQKIESEKHALQEKENKLSEQFIEQLKEEEQNKKQEQEKLLQFDESVARELATKLNAEINSVELSLQSQLSSDEEFAKQLASEENVFTEPSPVNLSKNVQNRSSKILKLVRYNPSPKSKLSQIRSPRRDKFKQKTIQFGPMDKYLETNSNKL